jgi:hypothetical protein
MAKQQSFADKSKAKSKDSRISVKVIKTVKSESGSYKFQEKFVKLEDVSKISELK